MQTETVFVVHATCRVLDVSASGFYAWGTMARHPSARSTTRCLAIAPVRFLRVRCDVRLAGAGGTRQFGDLRAETPPDAAVRLGAFGSNRDASRAAAQQVRHAPTGRQLTGWRHSSRPRSAGVAQSLEAMLILPIVELISRSVGFNRESLEKTSR